MKAGQEQNKQTAQKLTQTAQKQRRKSEFIDWLEKRLSRPVILLVVIALLAALFPYAKRVSSLNLPQPGSVSGETVIAPFTFDIKKPTDVLKKERQRARDQVLLVVDYDTSVVELVRDSLQVIKHYVLNLASMDSTDSLYEPYRDSLHRRLSASTVVTLSQYPSLLDVAAGSITALVANGISSTLLVESPKELEQLQSKYNRQFEDSRIYAPGFLSLLMPGQEETTVRVADFPIAYLAVTQKITDLRKTGRYSDEQLNAIYELLLRYVRPNVFADDQLTQNRKDQAASEVLEIVGKVIKDSEIVRKHQEVTPEIVLKLSSLHDELVRNHSGSERRRLLVSNLGRMLLILFGLGFVIFYIFRLHKSLYNKKLHLAALGLIIVLQAIIIRIGMVVAPRLIEGNAELTGVVYEYLIPVVVASILSTIFFRHHVGTIISLFTAYYFSICLEFNFSIFIITSFSGLVTCYVYKDLRYRWDFFRAMPPVFIVMGLLISLWSITSNNYDLIAIFQNVGLGVLSVIAATFIAMMATVVFETFFDITTNFTLVELSDMNHPVLKRLSIEASGTYNHSINVANLAESAAQKIGANALLVRVASYYHDIGKIIKKDYFIENYRPGEKGKHSKLTPYMSALIIASHVKDGLEMARKYKLPRVIQDAILQHHGTSTISYFYEKALEQDTHKQVQEKDFKYPGPIPQSRENAIIMLADSVEAACRSLSTSSPKLLRELVKKIIRDKFLSSQLDQSELTLRDLDLIIEGFMPILQGIFHTRIKYPGQIEEENANVGKKAVQ